MNANNQLANRNQTILFFQPRFGYIDINGKNSRWLHHAYGLLEVSLTLALQFALLATKLSATYLFESLKYCGEKNLSEHALLKAAKLLTKNMKKIFIVNNFKSDYIPLKAIIHFRNRKIKKKNHRFTNNLKELPKEMVKGFS